MSTTFKELKTILISGELPAWISEEDSSISKHHKIIGKVENSSASKRRIHWNQNLYISWLDVHFDESNWTVSNVEFIRIVWIKVHSKRSTTQLFTFHTSCMHQYTNWRDEIMLSVILYKSCSIFWCQFLPHLSKGGLPVLTIVSNESRSLLRRTILPSANPVYTRPIKI